MGPTQKPDFCKWQQATTMTGWRANCLYTCLTSRCGWVNHRRSWGIKRPPKKSDFLLLRGRCVSWIVVWILASEFMYWTFLTVNEWILFQVELDRLGPTKNRWKMLEHGRVVKFFSSLEFWRELDKIWVGLRWVQVFFLMSCHLPSLPNTCWECLFW